MGSERKRVQAKRFADRFLETGDEILAAREVSKSREPATLGQVAEKMLADPQVQAILNPPVSGEMIDRPKIAATLTEMLQKTGDGAPSFDQKLKIIASLEKLTRMGKEDTTSTFEKTLEFFYEEYGDALEAFNNGDARKFNKVFRPKIDKKGNVTFNVKKNDSRADQRMAILLQYLISRRVFS